MKFTVRVEIEADSLEAAEEIRGEMVGGAEDFAETQRTASASVGDLQEFDTTRHAALVGLARERHALASDNDIEVYDDARISQSDDGVFVEGFLWVPNSVIEEAGLAEDEEEELQNAND